MTHVQKPELTTNQRWLANENKLVEGLCFQPMAITYNFKKGVVRNEKGEILRYKGQPVMEKELISSYRSQYISELKETYGNNWKRYFNNPPTIAILN